MSQHDKFQRESQDARRQDQRNAVHPEGQNRSSKAQCKPGQNQCKPSANNKRK